MNKTETLSRIQNVFRDILDNEEIVLNESTTSNDIEEWDSLSHIQLIVAIEEEFDIEFTSQAIVSWKNVGDMVDYIIASKV